MRSLHVNPSAFVSNDSAVHVSGQPQSTSVAFTVFVTVLLWIDWDGFSKSYGTVGFSRDAIYHNEFVNECPLPPAESKTFLGNSSVLVRALSLCPRLASTLYKSTAQPSLTHASLDSQLSTNEGYSWRSHWSVSLLSETGVRGNSCIP